MYNFCNMTTRVKHATSTSASSLHALPSLSTPTPTPRSLCFLLCCVRLCPVASELQIASTVLLTAVRVV